MGQFDLHNASLDEDDEKNQGLHNCARAIVTSSNEDGVDFEVIIDESKIKKEPPPSSSSSAANNFFYDTELLNSLSLGSVHSGDADNGLEVSDSDDDLEPFEKMAQKMENLTGDGGVMKKMLTPGVGDCLAEGTVVRFHYSSYLEYGDEPLDSTFFQNKMARSKIGEYDVLPGLVVALASMRLKESARFILKPCYAFGENGCPPRIPANASILYEVKVDSIVDFASPDELGEVDWDWENLNSATFDERVYAARAFHRKGNSFYGVQNMNKARSCYQRALRLMADSPLADEEQETTSYALQTKLLANLAKIYLDQSEPTKACTKCRLALEFPYEMPAPLKAKIYFRYASAKAMLNSFEDARRFFLKAQKLKPNCPKISKHLEDLAIAQKKYQAQEKFMIKRMFGLGEKTKGDENKKDDSPTESAFITKNDPDKKNSMSSSDPVRVNLPDLTSQDGSVSEEKLEKNPKNISPVFIDIVLKELDRLTCSSEPLKEVVFPDNLTADELDFLTSTARGRNCQIKFSFNGRIKYPKVVRLPDLNQA